MAKISIFVCDACGKEMIVDDIDLDAVGMEIYCDCSEKVKLLFDGGGVKDLCDACALKMAKCFNDIVTKSNKNNT